MLVNLLAIIRLTRLIIYEDGPFDAVVELRRMIYDATEPDGWIQRGLACGHCIGFWLAFLFAPKGKGYVRRALGLAGAVSIVWKFIYE